MYNSYQNPRNINGYSQKFYNYKNNDDRFMGGFLGPFLLGGVTGGLVAPLFYGGYNNRPYYYYYNNYYYPYPYPPYGPYYRN